MKETSQFPKAAASDVTESPTVTHYDALAAQVLSTLQTMLEPIGPLDTSHPATRAFVHTNAAVDEKFILAVIAVVEETPELQKLFDVQRARDVLQLASAFGPIADRFYAMAQSLDFTIDARKAALVADALHVYAMAKRLAATPDRAALVPHVQNMQRELGRKHPRKRAKAPQSPQSPDSPQPPAQSPAAPPAAPQQKKEVTQP